MSQINKIKADDGSGGRRFAFNPSCQGRSGFTLIELLAAVSVISILAAILGANYIHAVHRADAAACQQNLRTVFTALQSYRLDYNHFPPADGVADAQARPDHTEYGCGPAANGFWSGVSLLLAKYHFCSEESLYCPALKRRYQNSIEAWPGCRDTQFAGRQAPQWRFLRFAYNNAAADAGGYSGGEHNIDAIIDDDVWLVRCLHVDVSQFDPARAIPFPFEIEPDEDHPGKTGRGEYELTLHGSIRMRRVN
ncbi:MAG: type II secretion system protein [Candidatus Omnitrophica bacterium]|nr:type II secretion system protein [Candidatus Omnitrophota bacterium]